MKNNRTCYIIEENHKDLKLLLSFISKIPELTVCGTAKNLSEGVTYLTTNTADILFLNLSEDSEHGLQAYSVLKTIPNLPQTIVTSQKGEFAVAAFSDEVPVDFLHKSFDFKRFLVAINRAINNTCAFAPLQNRGLFYFFKVAQKYLRINLAEILYFEASGVNTKVFLEINKEPLLINESILSVEEKCTKNSFIRIHKSYIVNVDRITGFDSKYVYIDRFRIAAGSSYKGRLDTVKQSFSS